MSLRQLALIVPALALACVSGNMDEESAGRAAQRVTNSDVMGVAVNVRWDDQRPSTEDLKRLGARWVRTLVYHDNHAQAADTLASYRAIGVRTVVLLNQESFASAGSIPDADDDAAWETYAAVFADEAAAFVKAHASAIDGVEVWNEPDLPTGGNIPPRRFGLLQYKVYPRLKAILGAAKPVVQGAVAGPSWPEYLRQAAQWMNARGDYSDGVNVHPYGQRADGYPDGYGFGEIESVVRTTYERGNEARAGAWKPVWITEFGLPREAGDASMYLKRAYNLFDRMKSEGVVAHAFWFAWDDRTHYDPGTESFGLVERDGDPRPLRDSGAAFSELAGPLATTSEPPSSEPPSGDPSGGTASVGEGAIGACYDRNGGAPSVGRPFDNGGGAEVHRWGAGHVQDFEGGSFGPNVCMQHDLATDAWMVRGAIRDVYLANGGAEGFLGYPIEDERVESGVPMQRFQNGYITHRDGEFRAFTGGAKATSCPCSEATNNFCTYGPSREGCPMTAPGGYCDPDGDGDFTDADWVRGWSEYEAACR